MKSHIKRISTKGMSQAEWLAWRNNGIGCSEIGTIMGLGNPKYTSNLEIHLIKSGQWDKVKEDSFHSYKGKVSESSIINDYWKYYTDNPESVLKNAYDPEYVKKKCNRVNAFLVNSKYPWLFGSLDRLIPKGHISRTDGSILEEESILEAKNMMRIEADKYEAGVSPGFMAQTQGYMAVTELKYAELMILLDATFPELYAFDRSDIFIDSLLTATKEFWDNVLKSRELMKVKNEALLNNDESVVGHIDYELAKLEPTVQGTEGYNQFLKEIYRDIEPGRSVLGSREHLNWANEYLSVLEEKKPLEEKEMLLKNKIQKSMGELDCEVLDFGQEGKISWKADIKGTRRFSIKLKK